MIRVGAICFVCIGIASSKHIVRSDVHWNDTDGNRIEAHGAGLLQSPIDKRWYWYGESKKGELESPGVNCYSADTLAGPWQHEGRVFGAEQIEISGWKPPF